MGIAVGRIDRRPSTGDRSEAYLRSSIDSTELPLDAWGNEFVYIAYPESGKPYVVISYGADGDEGGEEYDEDLYSTDAG